MALSEDAISQYSEHLSGYKSACDHHPELKLFDSKLEQRTTKMIEKIAAGAETGTRVLSLHQIHMEVSRNLVEVSQDVAKFIENEGDVWESRPLRSLVDAYFENTEKTLEIFGNVLDYVEAAEEGQKIIQAAVAQFDNEFAEKDLVGKKNRYKKTLKELNKYKKMGDPFKFKFKTQFKLIKEQQESLLKEVSEAKEKIDEDLKEAAAEAAHNKKWQFWSNVIFGAAVVCVGIASIALIATGVGAPAGIALLAAGVSVGGIAPVWIGAQVTLNKQIDDLEKQQEALKKQKDQLTSVERGVEDNKVALGSVSELVDRLEKKISSIMKYVDDAIDNEGDEVDTRLDLENIRDKVGELTKKIMKLGESVKDHCELIRKARHDVLEKMNILI